MGNKRDLKSILILIVSISARARLVKVRNMMVLLDCYVLTIFNLKIEH